MNITRFNSVLIEDQRSSIKYLITDSNYPEIYSHFLTLSLPHSQSKQSPFKHPTGNILGSYSQPFTVSLSEGEGASKLIKRFST